MGLEYINNFPSQFTPNDTQILLINNIEKAFKEGYKFVVCSAPTGSGKSFISKTLSEVSKPASKLFKEAVTSYEIFKRTQFGGYQYDENDENEPFGCFALTITKALQDQYQELFTDISILKGKSNYQCTYDTNHSVETAPCTYLSGIKENCWRKNSCLYYNARNEAIVSKFSALNYDMFFALPEHVKQKEFIICDEASELEDQLVKVFTCSINFTTLKKIGVNIPVLPSTNNYLGFGRWVESINFEIEDKVSDIKSNINSLKKNSTELQILIKSKELFTLTALHSKIKTLTNTWRDSEYIIERHETGVNFTPLKVDRLSKYIFDHGKKIVLMSATIIDPENFCKTLGVTNYKYIEAESTFDSKKAPIYISTKYKLNHSNLKSLLPKIAKQVEEICELHKDQKGIIHTHSNFITETLKRYISNGRIVYREPGTTNEDILKQHQLSGEPTIIASPSMSHGIDLKGDLARFQIIIKAPYLPIADKRIEKLIKSDNVWYINKMLSSFIQACGRGVRSKKDFCTTYVLDGALAEVILKNKNKIPKYFLDRFI